MLFNKFKRGTSDLLNEAHTLGLSALGAFETLASDLEKAADLAEDHATITVNTVLQLQQEADDAATASDRYATSARKIRALVS